MPIETAEFIDTLQPDWPTGRDLETGGDDHVRMTKKVLQNTFPNIDGAVSGTPEQINNITLNTEWVKGGVGYFNLTDPTVSDGSMASLAVKKLTPAQVLENTALTLNWETLMDLIYPVHKVLISESSDNPAVYLGFGTWEARSGTVYGVGGIADAYGFEYTIAAGVAVGSAWRVQNKHIVAAQLTVQQSPDNQPPTISPNGGGVLYPADSGTRFSIADPGIPNTGLTVTIGQGGADAGEPLIQPGHSFYIWVRTA